MKADCHMHMVLDGFDWKASIGRGIDDIYIRTVLESYQNRAYTYLRDGGDRFGVGKRARELAAPMGIVYRTPYAPLCKAGHYGAFIGTAWENLAQYARLVVKHREEGADFIKIMISGLMDFHQVGKLTEEPLTETEIKELIHIAHQEGMAVMAHCNGARTAQAAAEGGIDSIEHGAYLDTDALQAMKENRVIWVPTLSTMGNLLGKGRFDDAVVAAILDTALENVSGYHAMGGLVAPGSDAGAWAVPHDCDTESKWLQKAGVDPAAQDAATAAIMERF